MLKCAYTVLEMVAESH